MKLIRLSCLIIFLSACGNNQADDDKAPGEVKTASATSTAPGLNPFEEKDATGKVTSTGFYLDGKKEGSWATFFDTGSIATMATYVQDKKEGWFLEFKTGNQLLKQIMYRNDVRHGEYKEFFFSSIKEERFYQNGKQEGVTKVYYDGGKIQEEGAYKNGQRDGISRWYDQDGKVTIEYEYKNGVLVKK